MQWWNNAELVDALLICTILFFYMFSVVILVLSKIFDSLILIFIANIFNLFISSHFMIFLNTC